MSGVAQNLGLYVSVPFCRAKCSFCNFASGVGSGEAVERYLERLKQEIRGSRAFAHSFGAALPARVDTVYLGGGTPSLLAPQQLRELFRTLQGEFDFAGAAEVTLEAAPGQIGDDLLDTALEIGINRVSLGVQSLVDREAQAVGRSHTRQSCEKEFRRLRRAGVLNLGADLIAGLPYQTGASWECTLDAARNAELDHLSVYMLEVDEDSRLGREVLGGGARLHAPAVAGEDLVVDLYEMACDRLPGWGLEQYEISNFAAPGKQSRHNLKYWQRAPYLGFGLDAHSMLFDLEGQAVRWANADELAAYHGAVHAPELELVRGRAAFEETVFLGLRLLSGLPWSQLAPCHPAWLNELRQTVEELRRDHLMDCDAQRFWLTARGRVLAGEIFGELLAGVAA